MKSQGAFSKIKALAALFFFLIYQPLYAATCCPTVSFQPEKTYNLNSLIDMALACNPNTKVVWAQIKAACANIGIQNAAYYPTIIGNININDNSRGGFNNSTSGTNANNPFTSSNGPSGGGISGDIITYGAFITINYTVWDFGIRENNLKAAIYQWLATKFNGDESIQQVVQQVEQAYYQTLGYQALVVADQKSVKEAQFNLKSSQGLHMQGLAVIGDVYQAQSALAQAELTLEQARGNLAIAKGQLNVAVGLPITTCLKIRRLSPNHECNDIFRSIDRLLYIAEHKRPDLIAARKTICANQALLKSAIAQQYPVIQFTANAGEFFPKNSVLGGAFHNATLNLSFPILNVALRYQIKQAAATLEQSQAQAQVLSDQVDLQVWQAYYGLQTAEKTIQTTLALLKSSEIAAKQAAGQYRAGVGTVLNMLTTQATLETARGQHIQARTNWYITLAQLYIALGTLLCCQ
jgi:outer membrane protein